VSRRHPGKGAKTSRAELALSELCSKLGYCLPPGEQQDILANPPPNEEAFIEAVLLAEGRDPETLELLASKEERRQMLDVVARWAVFGGDFERGSIAERPRFPRKTERPQGSFRDTGPAESHVP